jgi:hypothetical protein
VLLDALDVLQLRAARPPARIETETEYLGKRQARAPLGLTLDDPAIGALTIEKERDLAWLQTAMRVDGKPARQSRVHIAPGRRSGAAVIAFGVGVADANLRPKLLTSAAAAIGGKNR